MVYVLLFACYFFSFFFECQSLAVCSGNSDGGGCCTGLRVRKEGTGFLLITFPDIEERKYPKEAFLSQMDFGWKCEVWKYKASLRGRWKLDNLPTKLGLFSLCAKF